MSQRLENISTQMEIILSAIYMATSHISDEQIIKQSLRSAALQVMAKTIELIGEESLSIESLKSSIKVNIYKVMSFIKVLRSERMMTDKNADLLIMTYKKLLSFINDYQPIDLYAVSDNVKDIDYNIYTGMSDNADFSNADLYLSKNTNKVNTNKKINQIESHLVNNNVKPDRRNHLLSIIKGGTVQGCNMSDILVSIKGISEKTVQRELNSMITDRLIIKKGEKRWSRYILPPVLL